MDAHVLTYADASFDCVVGQFVITLVADRSAYCRNAHASFAQVARSFSLMMHGMYHSRVSVL